MQPYDYTFKNIKSPVDSVMTGLEQGMALKETLQQKAYTEELGKMYSNDVDRNAYAQQLIEKYPQYAENTMKKYEVFDQQEKAKVMQEDLATLQNNPNPTAEDYLNFMTKHPTMAKDFETNYNILNKQKKETVLKDATELYAAVSSGNLELAEKILNTRMEAAKNSGMKKEEDGAKALLQLVKTNPNAAKTTTGLFLATAVGGSEAFTSMIKELNTTPKGTYQVLTPEEKKKLNLPLEGNYQISPDGKISEIGSKGVSVNIEGRPQVGTIPQGYQLTKKGDSWVMEPIPGSPQEQEVKNVATKKAKSNAEALTTGGIVFEDIERLKKIIKENSLVAGSLETVIPDFLIQDRINANMLKETIVANIGFDKLQRMREASPTGGALGSVSDRELSNLQAVLGNLSLSQSEDQLLANLDRLGKLYTNILKKAQAYPNAAEFGFGQKAKTVEEANSLGITFE